MRLKTESAMASTANAGCTTWSISGVPLASALEERHPGAFAVGNERVALVVPDDRPIEGIDQRGARPGHLLIGRAFAQAPGVVDAPVGAADGAGVPQAQASGDLLVGQPLRHQLADTQLVRRPHRARRGSAA